MQLRTAYLAISVLAAAACDKGSGTEPDASPMTDGPPADAAVDAGPDAPRVCDSEARDDDYVPGMSKTGANGFRVVLAQSTPAPSRKGNYAWNITVSDPQQQARDGLTVTVVPFMPDHHHGTSVQAIVTPAGSGGAYAISPINLFMTGYWTVRLGLGNGTTELDAVTYAFCVD